MLFFTATLMDVCGSEPRGHWSQLTPSDKGRVKAASLTPNDPWQVVGLTLILLYGTEAHFLTWTNPNAAFWPKYFRRTFWPPRREGRHPSRTFARPNPFSLAANIFYTLPPLLMDCWIWPTCVHILKTLASAITDIMKENEKRKIEAVVVIGVTKGHRQCHHSVDGVRLPIYPTPCTVFELSVESCKFFVHTCIDRPRSGWPHWNFTQIFGVRWLKLCAIVRHCLHDVFLTVLIHHRPRQEGLKTTFWTYPSRVMLQ